MYDVHCVAPNGANFTARDVYFATIHQESAHFLEARMDRGVVYHYLVEGETCGIQAQELNLGLPSP